MDYPVRIDDCAARAWLFRLHDDDTDTCQCARQALCITSKAPDYNMHLSDTGACGGATGVWTANRDATHARCVRVACAINAT